MTRLLYYGCTSGTDVAIIQNDLNLITRHTQQGSAMALLEVDGIFGTKSQSRVMEFQRLNGLTVDGVVGDQTRSKLDELFLSEPGLQAERIRGGVAGNAGNVAGSKSDGGAFGKMQPAGPGGGKTTGGFGGTKTMGGGGQGKTSGGYKTW